MGFFMFAVIELVLFAVNSCIQFTKKNEKYIMAGLMFLVMFIFAALRGSGDGDYYNYLWFSYDIGTDFTKVMNSAYPVEFSFRLFAYIFNVLGISRQWVIVTMNFFSLLPTAYVFIKKSENPFLSVLIFLPIFIQFDMQTSRTATAIGLGLLSIYFNSEKKYFKSILFLAFAISFHKSAAILLPFLIVMHIPIGNFLKILSVGLALMISVFSSRFMGIFSKLLSSLGLSRLATKVVGYTFEGRFASSMSFFDPRIIFCLLLFITSIMYYKKNDFKTLSMEDASLKAVWFSVMMYLVFRSSTAIAFRFGTFFTVLQALYIPKLIKDIRKYDRLVVYLLYLSILLFIIPYWIYLMAEAPSYDFFFTNIQAIRSLNN